MKNSYFIVRALVVSTVTLLSLSCTPKSNRIDSTVDKSFTTTASLSNSKLLPDIVIQKFDQSVRKTWKPFSIRNPSYFIVKDPDDSALEETYLDDAHLNLLKKNHTYKLVQYYTISESSSPILPNMLKEFNNKKALRAEIIYSSKAVSENEMQASELYQANFTADNAFTSNEGRLIAPSETTFLIDLMSFADSRGYIIEPFQQLKKSFQSLNLSQEFAVVTYVRKFSIKNRKAYGSGFTTEDIVNLSLNISYIKTKTGFKDPIYQFKIEQNIPDKNLPTLSAQLYKNLSELSIHVKKSDNSEVAESIIKEFETAAHE